jgi:tetratricopeptide (TPR) repeat protein/transcriptional regulator with XRE-family HTH domain
MTAAGAAFGARLSDYRRSAGLSQAELGERSGLSVRAISNLERGRTRSPHPDTVYRLADALGLAEAARAEFAAAAGRRLRGASADSVIAPAADRLASPGGERVVPRQLPGPVRQFTGRQNELAAMTGLLEPAGGDRPTAVVISALGGMAGVGKSALALHWAHQVAGQFPDGQLFVNLRGFDAGRPTLTSDALAGFLHALGVAGPDIPESLDARAAAYRSLLAGRRVLVMLDNAHDVAQVRPLLPGAPGCVTVVTSRDALGGLVAGDGAVRLEVDLLPLPEAVGLLRNLIGSRVTDDGDASVRLAGQCGRLPLALRVAAELVVARSGVALADLTTELADLQHRLDMLETGGDEHTTVRTVFTWSYQDLGPAAARMFRLAGIHPGPDISAPAAASLAAVPLAQARRALAELTRAHMLNEHQPGRFSCHDLLRVYAVEQARAHDSPVQRRAAMHRVLDHYLHTAYAGDRLLHPSRNVVVLSPPERGTRPETPADPEQAMAWFDAEHNVLLAAIARAAEAGFRRHAWQLPWSLATFFSLRAHHEDLDDTQRIALAAATSLGDVAAQALAADRLGFACLLRGQHQAATDYFQQALDGFQQVGDQGGEACTYLNVSFLLERQGRHAEAVREDEHALDLFQAMGHRAGQATALNAAGWHLALLGNHQQALTRCQQALALQRELDDRLDEANTWDSLGYIHGQLGQHAQAATCYLEALRLLSRTRERWRQATVLVHLGDTHHGAGDLQAADEVWRQAVAIFDDMHHPDAEAVRAKLTVRA